MVMLNIGGGSVEQFGMESLLNCAKEPQYNWTVRTTQMTGAVRAGYVDTLAKDCVKVNNSSLPGTDYYKKHLAAAIMFMTRQLKVSGGFATLTSIQSIRDGYLFIFQ